uniref:Ig-like domain-containing protein n=1 Tax=Equus caballus TaxID=9796 RepID=F6ZX94_HORSE
MSEVVTRDCGLFLWIRMRGDIHALWEGSGLGVLVSQHPSRAICKNGSSVEMECRTVDLEAQTVCWYHQLPNQGITLIATSIQGSDPTYEQGFPKVKFPISHPNLTLSTLTILSAHPANSGLYFCGASDTVLGRDQRLKHKPLQQPPLPHPNKAVTPCRRRSGERKTTASLIETSVSRGVCVLKEREYLSVDCG